MPDSRPMPGVAAGVSELLVGGFHAFVKKTQRTLPLEIELARKRLKELFDA
jgi:phage-related protein